MKAHESHAPFFVFYVFFVALFVLLHAMRAGQTIETSHKLVGKPQAIRERSPANAGG
jgi:hypothetical protein